MIKVNPILLLKPMCDIDDSNAETSNIRTINIFILINIMIKTINLIDVIPYMTVLTDISAPDTRQCHWNSTVN